MLGGQKKPRILEGGHCGNKIEQNQLTESEGLEHLCTEDGETLGFGVLGCKREKVAVSRCS